MYFYSSLFIALNGCVDGYFKGAKGLRQGDPISPYLFILVMEAFYNLLEDCTQQEGFVYHLKCSQLAITNVIFADNLFLLCGAECTSLGMFKTALAEFGE